MGTRSLGARPWLVVDERRSEELALKAALLADRHGEVFASLADTEDPSRSVLALVEAELEAMGVGVGPGAQGRQGGAPARHPLDEAGRLIQEDLCLLRRDPSAWFLVAASLCFPSRWRLSDKLGLPLALVHEPVDGYGEHLADRVDGLLDRLADRIVVRRNWFIHPDEALFQPDRPVGGDPVVAAANCLTGLFLRSERQTLRRIGDTHALFTIRIQQDPLEPFVAAPERRRALSRFVVEADDALASHRGLSTRQRDELALALSD